MTKEITKAIILQEIEDKFKLRELAPDVFAFSELVVPTYNVDPHLRHPYSNVKEMSVTSAGAVSFFVVPSTERWYLRRYDVIFMAAGAYTIAGLYVRRVHKLSGSATIYLDLAAAKSASYHIDLVESVRLDPGDEVLANVDGYTSTANLRVTADYEVEVIR